MGRIWAEHVLPMFCTCSFHGNSKNNLLSYCGLIDAKIRASDKDLPVSIAEMIMAEMCSCFYQTCAMHFNMERFRELYHYLCVS